MATTVTWQEIRENYNALITAAEPSLLSASLFHHPNTRIPLKSWALKHAGSHCFRAFALNSWSNTDSEPETFDTPAYQRTNTAELVIAYPVDVALYWKDDDDADLDNFEDVIEADSDQLRDILTSSGNLLTGHNEMKVVSRVTEQASDALWFHTLLIRVQYLCSQSLT